MSEMRRATWSGLDGRLVLRRPLRVVPAVGAEYAGEMTENVESPLAAVPIVPDVET